MLSTLPFKALGLSQLMAPDAVTFSKQLTSPPTRRRLARGAPSNPSWPRVLPYP